MKNSEIAKVLYDIADMLELKAEQFKPMAYRRAARHIEELSEDIGEVYSRGGVKALRQIPGVGESIAEKVVQLITVGKSKYYNDLKKKFPTHISSLIEVPGLGPKKVKVLHSKLKIQSVEDLEKAAKSHQIAKLKGFGEKTESDILKGIEMVKAGKKRMLVGFAMPIARELEKRLKSLNWVSDAVVAGSFRRRKETIGDLDILAVSSYPKKVMDFFVGMPDVERILANGITKSSVMLRNGLQVDLRVVEDKSFGAAMQYFTGDIQHNVRLREIAIRKGLKLNEYGLFGKNEKYIAGRDEKGVYNALGLQYIEPELRSDNGEIEAALAKNLPALIPYASIRGDLHVHTSKSDGAEKITVMVESAKSMGYEYVAITDHSVSERIAGGLPEEEMEMWLSEIRSFSRKVHGIKVLAGSEVSIRADGSLDYSDSLLKKMDIVVASVHSRFKSDQDEITRRILSALENEHVDILGHPTGRLIYRRDPLEFDLRAVLKSAVDNDVFLEINSQPDRMDLKDSHVREAKILGAKFVINTDAHTTGEMRFMELGVAIARRGWLGKDDVINTKPLKDLPKFFKKIRI